MAARMAKQPRKKNKAEGGWLSARSVLVRVPSGAQAIAINRASRPISGLLLLNTAVIITGGIQEPANETFL